jgi:hypothetical protein
MANSPSWTRFTCNAGSATNGAPPHPTAPELLKTLVEHRHEVFDFLRRRTRSESDAEDVLQQALLLATRKVQALREPALLLPWFYRVLRRVLADHVVQGADRAERLRRFPSSPRGKLSEMSNLPTARAGNFALSPGEISAALNLTGTTMRVVHSEHCPDIGPICNQRTEPPSSTISGSISASSAPSSQSGSRNSSPRSYKRRSGS